MLTSLLLAAALSSPAAAPLPTQNWAGYVIDAPAANVDGTFTVPAVNTCGGEEAFVLAGLGGYTSPAAVLGGVDADCNIYSGTTTYRVVALAPGGKRVAGFWVDASDSVHVRVMRVRQTYTVKVADLTSGVHFEWSWRSSMAASSAEWVVAARLGNAYDTDYGSGLAAFADPAWRGVVATVDGKLVHAGPAGAKAVTMVGETGDVLAQPGAMGTKSFPLAWLGDW